MIPVKDLFMQMINLLAADTTTLAAATAMHLHIAKAPFTPGQGLVIGDLTEATFTGSAAKAAGTGTQTVYRDPLDGLETIAIKEPAGSWNFVCTADPASTETIYGWYLTDTANAVLYGSQLLATPVPIAASGDAVVIPDVTLKFASDSPF